MESHKLSKIVKLSLEDFPTATSTPTQKKNHSFFSETTDNTQKVVKKGKNNVKKKKCKRNCKKVLSIVIILGTISLL